MNVKELIEHFQKGIEDGWIAADDQVVLRWWSVGDVDPFEDHDLTEDQKRTIWAKVVVQLEDTDTIDNEYVQHVIENEIETSNA